ncbi:hypothetical protein VDGD_00778 [Verticillium dahliae]|nr:hypothetical protein VDGD_00778 [Verticillium dahliae]
MLLALPPDPKKSPQKYARYQKKDYDERDLKNMERTNWFAAHERGYQRLQETKCVTLGYGLHDSPIAILAWMVGKLKSWTDDYPWTKEELINWKFMHYQGSPSAAMQIYKEALAVLNDDPDSMVKRYVTQPVGGSVFPKEVRSHTIFKLLRLIISWHHLRVINCSLQTISNFNPIPQT